VNSVHGEFRGAGKRSLLKVQLCKRRQVPMALPRHLIYTVLVLIGSMQEGILPGAAAEQGRPPATTGVLLDRAANEEDPKGTTEESMLDGIYAGLATQLRLSATGNVDRDASRVYVTFYPDGRVYRRVPEGGLEGWDGAAAEADVPALWGTYRAIGTGRWAVRWNESSRVSIIERTNDGLLYDGVSVSAVATCEGLLLEGTYVQPGALDFWPASAITFEKTGRFVDSGLIGELAYQNIAMPDPRTIYPGTGRYRIGRNTLYLEYDDGRRVPVELHADREAVAIEPVPMIHINGWALVRLDR
jgi:hypothetical protein